MIPAPAPFFRVSSGSIVVQTCCAEDWSGNGVLIKKSESATTCAASPGYSLLTTTWNRVTCCWPFNAVASVPA